MDNEYFMELKEKGISCECEYIDTLREYHITFSKDNKHCRKIIPIDDVIPYFSKSFITKITLEAEFELLNH